MTWLGRLFRKGKQDALLDSELRFHVEQQIADNIAAGMAPAEARRRALAQFGGVEYVKEECREARGTTFLETFAQDIRFALRMLRKSPGFAFIAILTLALGIGASTAVFSVVNAVLLKPMPFPHAERIVFPWHLPPAGINIGYDIIPWGRVEFLLFSRESRAFEALGAFQSDSFNLTGAGEPLRVDGLRASAGFFPALGVSPSLGRIFTAEEDTPGHEHEVILSDSLWRQRFGADRQILGRTLELNGAAYTIVGVMPRGFDFPRANEMPDSFTFARDVQLWVPLALNRGPLIPAEPSELAVVGRLRPGVSLDQAQAEMSVMGEHVAQLYGPSGKGWFNSRVTPLTRQATGESRRPLLLILAAVVVVLLIACSNVAGLLLTRSIGRKRELMLRSALGAARSRLIRQLLTESIVLAAAGGLAGILLAKAGIYAIRILAPSRIPRIGEISLDIRVLAFALGVTLLTGILFGIAPALAASRENVAEPLKDGSRSSGAAPAAHRARSAVLVSQLALAVVLVISAGLLTRSFYRLLSVDPGFHPVHVLTFEVSLPATKYTTQSQIVSVYHEALQRLRALPGVQSAAVAEIVPLGGATESTGIRIPGRVVTSRRQALFANYTMVSAGYFSAVGTPILRGRPFRETDTADSQPVTIISSAMAERYWPNEDPLGKQVGPGSPKYPLANIVGIAADVKRISLREAPPPEMYVPYTQKVWPSLLTMDFIVRTAQDPASFAGSARQAIRSVDADLPLANIRPLSDVVADSLAQPRFAMLLLGAFAALALLLTAIGMYGVVSFNVAQRTQEIGVRMALGAQRGAVLRMVLGQSLRLTVLGEAAGLAAAFAVTRLMSSLLYGVDASDPVTFSAVPLLLLGVTLFACYIPARRAMKVDPMVALRYE